MRNEYPAARAWLSRSKVLADDIRRKKARIRNLREASERITAQVTDMPRTPSPNNHRMDDLVARIVELEGEVREAELELKSVCADMVIRLDEHLKPEHATILNLRYVQFLSWTAIINQMSYSRSKVLDLHHEALASLDKILR